MTRSGESIGLPAQADSSARELATYFVGQVVGSMNKVQPTSAVVLEMVSEFIDTVGRLDELVEPVTRTGGGAPGLR